MGFGGDAEPVGAPFRVAPPTVSVPLAPLPATGLSDAGNASRNLRTTGASMVEEADLTNSPSSWSLVITSLLDCPSSFAIALTRVS